MKAIDVLNREHEFILRALELLDGFVDRMARGEQIPSVHAGELVSILQSFGERCHHGKEEQSLFPMLEAHGIRRRGGPIGQMLEEHDRARKYLVEMADGCAYIERSADARARFASGARAYSEVMHAHITRETDVLFAIAEAVLDAKDDEKLVRAFELRDHDILGPGEHERLETRLRALTHKWAA
jgi:hemerythrin-like domain-containing protein